MPPRVNASPGGRGTFSPTSAPRNPPAGSTSSSTNIDSTPKRESRCSRSRRRSSACPTPRRRGCRSEEHTSELQSLMRSSYAVFCLKNKHRSETHTSKPAPHYTQLSLLQHYTTTHGTKYKHTY